MPEFRFPEIFVKHISSQVDLDVESFTKAHLKSPPVSIRINPSKTSIDFSELDNVPWCETGYYLQDRPKFYLDPAFHSGSYYVQGASSMFLEQAVALLENKKSITALDLCAAPGGKSTHLLSLIGSDGLLVSNEVLHSRIPVLSQNLTRWGYDNVIITQNDPHDFEALGPIFDLVLVDAPCSGEGLFRKYPDSVNHWSIQNIELCEARQKRILHSAIKLVKPGGLLIYSTCTFEPDENEKQFSTIMSTSDFLPARIPINNDSGIEEINQSVNDSQCFGYRFLPNLIEGDGFFLTCFKKSSYSSKAIKIKKTKLKNFFILTRDYLDVLSRWISTDDKIFLQGKKEKVHAFPNNYYPVLGKLSQKLNVRSFGVEVGRLLKNNIIPAHSLGLYPGIDESIPRISLTETQAIQYLSKDPNLSLDSSDPGWKLMTYSGNGIGWIKNIPGRINNYYPVSWRILNQKGK